ncbi:MAG TPA: VOC family protein [Rhizomicrobium sp.]|nr:VOC family protein [Rhizomicrobium sp.]
MLRIDHVVFPVWDAKASLAFYRDVMGFALINALEGDDWGGHPWLMMIFSPGDGREIVLVALKGAKQPKSDGLARDVRHLAFAEGSLKALGRWRRKLSAAGVRFWEEDHGPQKSIYFEDPNGIVLEITAPPSRARGRTRKTALTAAETWIAA